MKKPGDFQKQKAKHKKIQHNRDQLKLMREGIIPHAELFIMELDGLKKITIEPIPQSEDYYCGFEVVFLRRRGKRKGLVRDIVSSKDGMHASCGMRIDYDDVFGKVIEVESASNNPNASTYNFNKDIVEQISKLKGLSNGNV